MLGLLLAALFILLNGFFVAAEFAFVKLHATQSILEARIKRKERSAIHAKMVLERLDSFLSVTQFGVTLASLGLGWIGEPAVEAFIRSIIGTPATESKARHAIIAVVSFGILTLGHVLIGELVPKLVAIQRSEATALVSATPLRILHISFRPLLWVLETLGRVILKSLGLRSDVSEGALTEEEILGVLAASTQRTPKGKEKAELLARVVRFGQRTARHAMVPRVDVISLPVDTTPADALRVVQSQGYSRIPLTKKRALDEVVGYLYAKDLAGNGAAARGTSLEALRRDVLFVPETQGLLDVLRAMQTGQTHIAVVVDEYGGTSGILTLEDLLEEIVGEIRDESDEEQATVVKIDAGVFEIDPRATFDELGRLAGLTYESGEGAEPTGAAVLATLGRMPKVGDTVPVGQNGRATILTMNRRRVTRLKVEILPDEPA